MNKKIFLTIFITLLFVFPFNFSGYPEAFSSNNNLPADKPPGKPPVSTTPSSIPPPPPPPTPVPSQNTSVPESGNETEKSRVQISSDHLSGDDNTKTFDLWGNVKITQEDSILTSDKANFNSKTKIAVASENVKFTKPGTVITGDKVTIYYQEKRGIWEGNVHVVQDKTDKKDKKDGKAFKDGPVDLYSDTLEFFWEKPRKGIANGNVKVHQNDKHVYSDKGTYTEKPQTILLENNVKLEKDDGSWMTCDQMTLHVKEETVEAEGNVKGSMLVDENKLD